METTLKDKSRKLIVSLIILKNKAFIRMLKSSKSSAVPWSRWVSLELSIWMMAKLRDPQIDQSIDTLIVSSILWSFLSWLLVVKQSTSMNSLHNSLMQSIKSWMKIIARREVTSTRSHTIDSSLTSWEWWTSPTFSTRKLTCKDCSASQTCSLR